MARSIAGLLLIIHTALTLVLQLASLAVPSLASWLGSDSLIGLVSRSVIMQGGLILLPVLMIIVLKNIPAEQIAGGRRQPSSLILAAVIGVPAAVVFQGLNNLCLYFLVRFGWELPKSSGISDRFSTDLWQQSWQVILIILLIRVMTPAVIEELMFRGVIQGSLLARGSAATAIFWQAVAFSLFHNDPLFILPPLLAGLLLGYLRYNSNSLLPSMIAHTSLNLTLLAIAPILPRLTAQYLRISTQTSLSLFYASLIATFVAAVALVPLLALISRMKQADSTDDQLLVIFPGDWKFALALLMLLATMMVTYYHSI